MRGWQSGFAASCFVAVIAVAADDALKQGIERFERGDNAAARTLLAEALKRTPGDATTLYYLGRTQGRLGDWAAEIEAIRQAVAQAPSNAEYHFHLGLALSRYIDTVSALRKPGVASDIREHLIKAIELDPELLDARDALLQYELNAPGFLGGGVDKAREQAAEIARRSPAYGHVANAEIATHEDQDQAALAEYQAALKAEPRNRDAVVGLGQLYQKLKRYDEASALLSQSVREDPRNAPAQYEFGRAAALSGQHAEEGIAALHAYLDDGRRDEDEPTPAAAHFQLGRIAEKLGRREEARKEYQLAVKFGSDSDEAKKALEALN